MTTRSIARRHDLDALRAVAMLLGIVLHAGLSFVSIPWPVQDSQQQESLGLLYAAIHGFRMPLFFLVSGFFTAMLWRSRGLKALAWHRCRRILLPLVLGVVTIVPAVNWASGWAMRTASNDPAAVEPIAPKASENLWEASARGELASVKTFLADGADLNELDPTFRVPPLTWATLYDQTDVVGHLLDTGAEVSVRSGDGGTPLHAAAFLGYAETAALLIDNGAQVDARNNRGETPFDSASVNWKITNFIAGFMKIELDEEELMAGRAVILKRLAEGRDPSLLGGSLSDKTRKWIGFLTYLPLFHHLWFLWYLCWLVAGFMVIAWGIERIGLSKPPRWLVFSPLLWLWLIPLTMVPQSMMGLVAPTFGPETSTGLIPLPYVLGYYAIFFGFGALYFHYNDENGRLGRWWWITLPLAMFVVLPLGLMSIYGEAAGKTIPGTGIPMRVVAVLAQSLYAWLMTVGSMGLFRKLFSSNNKSFRYVSDSSYWLYLAHLPLIILMQAVVRNWPLPAVVKFVLIIAASTAVLLLSYQLLIRYTWVGSMLNGPRTRGPVSDPVSDSTIEIPPAASSDS